MYVVRLDENSVEFVAQSGNGYGACIVNSGDYYIFNSKTIKRLTRPDLLTGYSNPADAPAGLVVDVDSMGNPSLRAKDVTSFNYDLAGTGSTQNYFAGLSAGGTAGSSRVGLYRIDDGAKYHLTVTSGYVSSTYGAAWTFRDSAGNDRCVLSTGPDKALP